MSNRESNSESQATRTSRKEISCPYCGESGFDGRGSWRVGGSHYYMHGCWNCGGEFLTEEPWKDD